MLGVLEGYVTEWCSTSSEAMLLCCLGPQSSYSLPYNSTMIVIYTSQDSGALTNEHETIDLMRNDGGSSHQEYYLSNNPIDLSPTDGGA